jgi:hypothetical protein
MSRIKVTYVAIGDSGQPIMTAESFDNLRKGLDDYYAVESTEAKCLGFVPYNTKYPDSYEGHFTYSYTMILHDEKITELDVIKVYCVDYFPLTKIN